MCLINDDVSFSDFSEKQCLHSKLTDFDTVSLYSKLWLRQKHMLQETEAVKGPGSFLLPFDNSTSSGVLNAVFF